MRQPELSAVGTGISEGSPDAYVDLPPVAQAVATPRPVNLYTDQRIAHIGDILTVNISINDKAVVGNSSDRSTTSKGTMGFRLAVYTADGRQRRIAGVAAHL